MIKQFLIERRSWIALVLTLQLLVIFVAFIDPSIPLHSLLYIVFLSLIIFIIFLFFRYHKETRYYKSLEEWQNDYDISTIRYPISPFEKMLDNKLISQTESLKHEISQNQLALEQEKDELLSWIHEVKTPLSAMSLIIERLDENDIKKNLTYEWLRIHLLLDQQLHKKRIPSIENDLFIENVDLKSILILEIKTLQTWCLQKGIGFEIDLVEKSVLSDSKWLAFIIRQLLTNAVKYSEESDIKISSFINDDRTHLSITDKGRGISVKDIPRIFDKGFTSTTNHQDTAATGMGLYLAQKAGKSLLINIHVQSTLGEGSTFTLRFPKRNEFLKITGM
ncbi:sensor histidine kinase [Cytobacillus suaedae]|nr:sensor histidine kinase [Cytobacillus suaedae]